MIGVERIRDRESVEDEDVLHVERSLLIVHVELDTS
jgi:hypothetical protein